MSISSPSWRGDGAGEIGFRVGVGYRRPLHEALLAAPEGTVDFLELAPENYAGAGGDRRRRLETVAARWPVLTHGLALSLGGEDPLDRELVEAAAGFSEAVGTPWHSDHVCFSAAGGAHSQELLPVPMTRQRARHTARRVREIAEELPVPMAVEHVSAYAGWPEDELDEAAFVSEVVERAGCGLLLDVNNVWVNAANFGQDPYELLARMPLEATWQIHVAGFDRDEELLIDSHGAPIAPGVWGLLEEALRRTGPVPVLLERDNDMPPFEELAEELAGIRAVGERVFGASSGATSARGRGGATSARGRGGATGARGRGGASATGEGARG